MDHQHVVLFCQRNHPLEKVEFHTLCGGIGREAKDHHFWLGVALTNGAFQLIEEVDTCHQRHRAYLRSGNHRTVDMNRIARVRYQHGITMIQRRQHQVRQSLFGADGDNRLGFGIDLHLVTIGVPARDRPAQTRNTA